MHAYWQDHVKSIKAVKAPEQSFMQDVQDQWQSTFKYKMSKAPKKQKSVHKDLSSLRRTDISVAQAEEFMPMNSNIAKDPKNGRWRISWSKEFRHFPLMSRSWASRGPEGEHVALKEVLLTAWTAVTAITGLPCPHSGIE